jgi:polyisoprenoid-binding protein YceI
MRVTKELMMTTYLIDLSHSSINFSVKHMMIAKVHGGFERFSGKLNYDSKNPELTKAEATIEVDSVNTRDSQRDNHLRKADFFDVDKYPTISFISRRVVANDGELKIVGDLTIHGVTQSVSIDVETPSEEMKDPCGNVKIGLSGKTRIKRKAFGLNWNAALEAGGFLVGDDVTITLDMQFIKQV